MENKSETSEATDAFLKIQEEKERSGSPRKDSNAPGDHQKPLPDPRIAMAATSKTDEKSTNFIAKVKSIFPPSVSHLW